jgi:small subunit ribosomal protein S18
MPTTTLRRREEKSEGAPEQARGRPCPLCAHEVDEVDLKDAATLRRFVSEKGRIRSRRATGACRRHQLHIAAAVKRAREMALLPHVNS